MAAPRGSKTNVVSIANQSDEVGAKRLRSFVELVIPELQGKLHGFAVRAPALLSIVSLAPYSCWWCWQQLMRYSSLIKGLSTLSPG